MIHCGGTGGGRAGLGWARAKDWERKDVSTGEKGGIDEQNVNSLLPCSWYR